MTAPRFVTQVGGGKLPQKPTNTQTLREAIEQLAALDERLLQVQEAVARTEGKLFQFQKQVAQAFSQYQVALDGRVQDLAAQVSEVFYDFQAVRGLLTKHGVISDPEIKSLSDTIWIRDFDASAEVEDKQVKAEPAQEGHSIADGDIVTLKIDTVYADTINSKKEDGTFEKKPFTFGGATFAPYTVLRRRVVAGNKTLPEAVEKALTGLRLGEIATVEYDLTPEVGLRTTIEVCSIKRCPAPAAQETASASEPVSVGSPDSSPVLAKEDFEKLVKTKKA